MKENICCDSIDYLLCIVQMYFKIDTWKTSQEKQGSILCGTSISRMTGFKII